MCYHDDRARYRFDRVRYRFDRVRYRFDRLRCRFDRALSPPATMRSRGAARSPSR